MRKEPTELRTLKGIAGEAFELRKPQKHDREWFQRIDRILDCITLLHRRELATKETTE